jgi:hemerythrin
MRVEWEDRLATGVANIDAQHKEIFKRFNALLKACETGKSRAEVVHVLNFVSNYIQVHFKMEEELQQSINFPDFTGHKRDHVQLTDRFKALEKSFASHGASVQLVMQTGKLLAEWLIEHIQQKDMVLAEFVRSRGKSIDHV